MQPFSTTTFNRTYPQARLTPPSVIPSSNWMHNKILIATTQQTAASLLTLSLQLLTSRHLLSRRLYIQQTGIPLRYHCAWMAVKKHWVKPTVRDFNDWLKVKAEAHDWMKNTAIQTKTEDKIIPVTKSKVASKEFAANTQQRSFRKMQRSAASTSFPSCIVCKGSHRLWECRVFKEKTPTQRAKVVAKAKHCFFCLRDKHTFRQCPSSR